MDYPCRFWYIPWLISAISPCVVWFIFIVKENQTSLSNVMLSNESQSSLEERKCTHPSMHADNLIQLGHQIPSLVFTIMSGLMWLTVLKNNVEK